MLDVTSSHRYYRRTQPTRSTNAGAADDRPVRRIRCSCGTPSRAGALERDCFGWIDTHVVRRPRSRTAHAPLRAGRVGYRRAPGWQKRRLSFISGAFVPAGEVALLLGRELVDGVTFGLQLEARNLR